jgi:uroporphyrin-3 C-methyltransferase
MEELRGRAQGPERAWSRAEAMYLLELAQRRLVLDRDLETAIVAVEAADARLASLRDASVAAVRQQIARDLQALRAVQSPDTTGISAKLTSIEERVAHLPVRGIIAAEPRTSAEDALPDAFLPRAWAIVREEALLRREHLKLLLFAARSAVARHDAAAYRATLASARTSLSESFDLSDPGAQAVLQELQTLEPIRIDPPLPDLSSSSAALRKQMPAPRGPE